MKRTGGYLWLFTLLLLPILLSALVSLAEAHGGGTLRLANEPAGPYWLSLWTSPDPARAKEPLHMTIGVTEPGRGQEAGPPVLDATVRVMLAPALDTGASATATATGGANRLLYEADVTLPDPGLWAVRVDVEGPEGSGSVAFDLEVAEGGSGPNWLLWGGGGALVIAALFQLARRPR